jgi:hypothetical protein
LHASLLVCAALLFLGSVLLQAFLGYWVSRNAPAVFRCAPKPDPFVQGAGFHWALHFLSARKRQTIPSPGWRVAALVSAWGIVASLLLALFTALHFAATGGTF